MSFKYVIIGGSAGGVGAVEAIREIDKRGSLAVIAEEPVPQYSKPMISEYVGEGVRLEEILYRPIEFWEENSVNLFSGRKAFMVDVQAREVTLEDNSKVYFEKLLIATGGRPIVPKIAGVDRRGVYTFTSLIDVRRLVDGLADAGHIVIVGGGLIGVSLAEALVKLRKDVTIVELKDRILSLILDAEGSSLVAHRVEQAGVKIITGRSVREILSRKGSKSQVGGVLLDNGTELSCGVVVFAIGVTPRIDMISPNQVKVNRGVVVDRYMATSAPGVYACGDAAEAFDFTWEESRLLPLWPLAYIGGRVAGSNMAGVRTVYQGGTQMSALNYFGLPVIS
ncbi:MAG: FAD-dependent oxidoreductase, partial [Candidatus Bathyarchaeia archaeon]